jgi:hypothetical protein
MMDAEQFADKQMELAAEFAKFVFDHPEVDERIPSGAYVYFHLRGEQAFNRFGKRLAEKMAQKNEVPVVLVRINGLARREGSRMVEPFIESFTGSLKQKLNKGSKKRYASQQKRSVKKGA